MVPNCRDGPAVIEGSHLETSVLEGFFRFKSTLTFMCLAVGKWRDVPFHTHLCVHARRCNESRKRHGHLMIQRTSMPT